MSAPRERSRVAVRTRFLFRAGLRRSMGWSEENLHAWLLRRRRDDRKTVGFRGDDAAVLRSGRGRAVLCADQTIEQVHFEPGTPASRVGRKAAARALSDLAATGASPEALLLALHADGSVSERHLREVIAAVDRTGARFGAPLVGGDLAQAPGPLGITVSALGSFPRTGKPPGRDRVRPGDVLLLTGPVGGSGLGRHLAIEPRISEGLTLYTAGARAMMDVSDGLARDLARMAAASGVRIDLELVPIHPDAHRAARRDARTALEHALHDGEDHELVAALPARVWTRVETSLQARMPKLTRIGHARRGRGLWLADARGKRVPWDREGGYVHGA